MRKQIERWREVTAREYPDRPELLEYIPTSDQIDINKLIEGTTSTDTCNTAQKLRRILVEHISSNYDGVVYEQDCMHHLRNVWINGVSKAVSAYLYEYLEDSLEKISSFLRISPDLAHIIRAFHKEFSLTANYPKGHGEKFRDWMIEKYPNEYLMHTERATGSRQDLITMGAGPIYWNRTFNVEFLDKALRERGNENLLQKNLFVCLSSVEMIAVSRFFSIIHVAISMPFRWLAGNTHKPYMREYKWGPRSMGRAIDIIHSACKDILEDMSLIHDELYMMHIFDGITVEIKEFKDYLTSEFETKTSYYVKKSKSKAVPLKMLIKELFSPRDRDNKDSTPMLEKIGRIGIEALLGELENQKKATYKYLSMSESNFSFEHCPDATKDAMIGLMATNDLAESSFAGVTAQVQCYGRIGMCNAAAVSETARNGFLSRPLSKKDIENDDRGLFHGMPEELKVTLIMVAMEDAPETRQNNSEALDEQRKMRKLKENFSKLKDLESAEDDFIEDLIYYRMWNSDACWKTIGAVTEGLKKLITKKDKIAALKDNIQIRYKGFGWEECRTQWSKGGVNLSIAELTNRLKEIIKMQKKTNGRFQRSQMSKFLKGRICQYWVS